MTKKSDRELLEDLAQQQVDQVERLMRIETVLLGVPDTDNRGLCGDVKAFKESLTGVVLLATTVHTLSSDMMHLQDSMGEIKSDIKMDRLATETKAAAEKLLLNGKIDSFGKRLTRLEIAVGALAVGSGTTVGLIKLLGG